jgi:hypothetical protein
VQKKKLSLFSWEGMFDSQGFWRVSSSISEVVDLFGSIGSIPGGGKTSGGQTMYPDESIKGNKFVSLVMLDSFRCSCFWGEGYPRRSRVERRGSRYLLRGRKINLGRIIFNVI